MLLAGGYHISSKLSLVLTRGFYALSRDSGKDLIGAQMGFRHEDSALLLIILIIFTEMKVIVQNKIKRLVQNRVGK